MIVVKNETEKMLEELTKNNSQLKEYADQYGRQLEAAVAVTELRKNARISQRDLAEKAGVSKSTITRIEKGNMNPSLKTLDKLGAAVGKHLSISYD